MSARQRSEAASTDGEAASGSVLLTPRHRLAAAVLLSILSPAFSVFVTATAPSSVVAEIGGLALYAWASSAWAT